MTAWVAGLAFVSANPGVPWSCSLAGRVPPTNTHPRPHHWYWIRRPSPAMIFLGLVMMPFYYISKDLIPSPVICNCATVSGHERALSAVTFRDHDPSLCPGVKHVRHGCGDEGWSSAGTSTSASGVSIAGRWVFYVARPAGLFFRHLQRSFCNFS